uniref:Uncharacterized protein n=1 Tax=Anguilla anguilla TaxID=7936 RepID=A0A0E9WDB9_ANGAN
MFRVVQQVYRHAHVNQGHRCKAEKRRKLDLTIFCVSFRRETSQT